MLNKRQIKLVQIAVRKAGLRGKGFEGRYRILLAQYKQPNGSPVTSCKQLNNYQLDDILAICESLGWQCPGKPDDNYRQKINSFLGQASFAQQSAIKYLAGDLGWNDKNIAGMIGKMTNDRVDSIVALRSDEAYKIIEALKAMFARASGKPYSKLQEIKEDMEAKDGKEQITNP